jgi:hypothetical protein
MANPCGGLTNTPSYGDICQHGYMTGVLMSEEKLSAITETNAALLATWQTLLKADMPNRLVYIPFDINEFAERETVQQEMDNGSSVILDTKLATNTHKLIMSMAAAKTLLKDFASGRTTYIWGVTSKGFIRGKEVTANTIEQYKVNVYASLSEATKDSAGFVNLYIQPLEDWEPYMNAINPDFDVTALDSVQMMTFTVGTTKPTQIPITAKDFDKVAITGLSTTANGGAGYFTLYNVNDSAAVTVTSITRSGGVYTLNFAAQTVGDVITVGYGEPSSTGEYYDLTATVNATIAAS